MLLFQSTRRAFAPVAPGVEELAASELLELAAEDVTPTHRGLHFVAPTDQTLWQVVYGSRLLSRVLLPVASFACHSARYLHRRGAAIEWEELMRVDESLSVTATVANSSIRHSQYAALTLKDAVCDRFRDRTGRRPDVDRRDPDIRLHVHVQGNKATVSIDAGCGSMHRRGYRTRTGEAPMQETLAAAVLSHARWSGETPLLDPMCGSGTLLAEALMRASAIPASHLHSRFGFTRLPGFEESAWKVLRADLDARIAPAPPVSIAGADVDPEMVSAARENLSHLPGGDSVEVRLRDLRDHPGLVDGTVVTNPPYGVRMGKAREVGQLMRDLGDFLKRRCQGSSAWIYLGDRELIKHVGLRPARRIPLRSGALDGRLIQYELY